MHLYPRGNVMSEADTSADAQGGRGHRPVPSAEAFDRETSAELARRLHAMSTDSFAETAPNFRPLTRGDCWTIGLLYFLVPILIALVVAF
jgi:hypothetical protein